MAKKALIIQGGGFRTAFSAGVLDAFRAHKHDDFDAYVAVSGGAIALSYFLSGQYRKCYEAICFLAQDKHFMNWNRLISANGIMDVDYFRSVADEKVPFDLRTALGAVDGKELAFVFTTRETGEAVYYQPDATNWVEAVIATCTLPFVTKGRHTLDGVDYFDGGWADPLPVHWAYRNGATEMVVIRTTPATLKVTQTWPDYLGTWVHRSNEKLSACFDSIHIRFNAAVDFLTDPPQGVNVTQIAPQFPLQTGTYSNNVKLITEDYRCGLEAGIHYLMTET